MSAEDCMSQIPRKTPRLWQQYQVRFRRADRSPGYYMYYKLTDDTAQLSSRRQLSSDPTDRNGESQHGNSSVPDSHSALTSEVLYSVFEKYGTGNGTIDFHGFEELLTNLGLGKVQIIEEEADLTHGHGKHDYATHLDLIDHHGRENDVHNHSADHDDHFRRHGYHRQTTDHSDRSTIKEHHTTTRDDTKEQTSYKARGLARDRTHGSIEPGEHDSIVKHGSIEPDEHGSTFTHGSIEPDEHDSIEPVRSMGQQGHDEAEERHGKNGENDRDSEHNPVDGGSKTDSHSSSRHSRSSDDAKKAQRLDVRDSRSFLLTELDSPAPRLKRRSVPKQARIGHAHAHEEGGHFHEPHETDEKCLSPKEILNDFSITSEALISERQFLHICPLLITQIDSRACIQHSNNTHAVRTTEPLGSGPGAVWGWASLAVTVISLVSLLAVAMVPLTTRSFYTYLITFLVALAVGCLSGDAVLHLIPHALGIHGDHDEAEQDHVTEADPASSVWKGCVVLVGIFSFFILEKTIGVVTSARIKVSNLTKMTNRVLVVSPRDMVVILTATKVILTATKVILTATKVILTATKVILTATKVILTAMAAILTVMAAIPTTGMLG
ncbi:hypothetical protein Bbelb_249980 [Branchiostoma belcheri]|nr:hypothetical protein Bbelb_249980 [Branchiostoma belcheri]